MSAADMAEKRERERVAADVATTPRVVQLHDQLAGDPGVHELVLRIFFDAGVIIEMGNRIEWLQERMTVLAAENASLKLELRTFTEEPEPF